MERWNVTEPKLPHLSHPLMHCYLVVTGMDCLIWDRVEKREFAALRQHVSFRQLRTCLPYWLRLLCAKRRPEQVQRITSLLDNVIGRGRERNDLQVKSVRGLQIDHKVALHAHAAARSP
jgi:hypothetical protein